MGQFLRYCLLSEREAFLADLRPKFILSSLIAADIITDEEKEEILNEKTSKRQVLHLMEILPKKGPEVFDCFVKALQEEDCYPWLADKLLAKKKSENYGSEVKSADELHKQLVAGYVPFQTNYFYKREKLMTDIHKALKHAAKMQRHWVVLHGMVGCGKSVLAAEAIRDVEIFSTCFPKGVCWIPFGNVKTNVNLKLKMQVLWERLDCSPSWIASFNEQETVDTSDDAIRKINLKLRRALNEKEHDKFLLVLDDVWQYEVIKAFDVHCPIIVTTRDKSISERVSSFCTFIDVGDNEYRLKLADTMKFLAPYVKVDPSELPKNEISSIHIKCKGLPIMLSLVGCSISRWGNKLERWKKLSKSLEEGFSETFLGVRNTKDDIYRIHNMIKKMIESLDPDLRENYFDLAVFEEDVFIRTKVLETMWKMNKIEVEDIMCELNQKSLVLFEEDPNSDSYRYSVHDLYLDVLKDQCENLDDRHIKLVKNYLELCKNDDGQYNYGNFPDDGYIYFYIGHHLKHSGMTEYFPRIFLDLSFIQNKLQYSGPSDLLYDLDCYKGYFEEVIDEVKDIDAFIRRNAHLISQKDSDIIQLALFEPEKSTVHINAKKAAQAKTDKIYFEWRNQENVPYRSILNAKFSFNDLQFTVFSPDNNFVATVSGNFVLIWDSTSGKELDKFYGHTGAINHCSFNASGSVLATCSKDKTVRIWEISSELLSTRRSSKTKKLSEPHLPSNYDCSQNKNTRLIFTHHEAEVNCCSFSADRNFIVSGDAIGVVYVWEVFPMHVKHKLELYIDEYSSRYPVSYCNFISQHILAVASDSNIYIYDITSSEIKSILEHEDRLVTSFCFSSNHESLFSASGCSLWKWDVNKFSCLDTFKEDESYNLCCCCVSPNGKYIAAGTSDCSVIVWNISSRKPVVNLKGHKVCVKSVSYSNDGNKLLSASEDGHVIIWNMRECNATSMLSLKSNLSVQCHDNLMIASSDELNCIQVRSGFDGKVKYKSKQDASEISACLLSNNCSEVVYGTKNGAINVFDLTSNKTMMCAPHKSKVNCLVQMKNLGFISCSEDSTIRIWNMDRKFREFRGHLKSVLMCVLYNDEKMLLSCSEDGTLRVWEVDTAKKIMVLEGHGNQNVTFCDVSPCEKYFCSSSTDKTIKLWDATNGRELHTYKCEDCVRCCRFSPLKNILLSGEDSGKVMMWNIPKKDVGEILGSHDTWVTDIKFSSDGHQFATVSDNIKLWTKQGHLALTILLPGAFPCAFWASPDFKLLIVIHNSVLYILNSIL